MKRRKSKILKLYSKSCLTGGKKKDKIKETINKIYEAAKHVYKDLDAGWSESIYQKAMKIELKKGGIVFESQRILPIFFKNSVNGREYYVGDGVPDLIVWVENESNRIAIVIDLKVVKELKSEHIRQVQKYIDALSKQLKHNENVYEKGILINFGESNIKLPSDFFDVEYGALKIIEFGRDENIDKKIDELRKKEVEEKK